MAAEFSHKITVFKRSYKLWFCPFFKSKLLREYVAVSGVFVILSHTSSLVTGKNQITIQTLVLIVIMSKTIYSEKGQQKA